jgi:hypothetical protein
LKHQRDLQQLDNPSSNGIIQYNTSHRHSNIEKLPQLEIQRSVPINNKDDEIVLETPKEDGYSNEICGDESESMGEIEESDYFHPLRQSGDWQDSAMMEESQFQTNVKLLKEFDSILEYFNEEEVFPKYYIIIVDFME